MLVYPGTKTWKAPLTRNLHRLITCHYSINQQQAASIPRLLKAKGDKKKTMYWVNVHMQTV